ncbi:expressed unknown protein [Seminavis robusta]|uniref:Uncharacterized protein n=1 Tax=Seminavis robusta TaxID=568900 RepID=A0A9N8HNQ1_9STRA|nr:expressed unknown protein [Seminavis robusta]|eukprot:Sro840_g209400.1 n/a (431) ;mRNA; r:18807-20099
MADSNNARRTMELELGDTDELRSAKERLKKARQRGGSNLILKVTSHRFAAWEDSFAQHFFQELSSTPQLQQLDMEIRMHSISSSLVAATIQNSRNTLRSLKLCRNTFVGEVGGLCQALHRHPSLETACLRENCFKENETMPHQREKLVAVVDALTTCSMLQSLELKTVSNQNKSLTKRGAKIHGISVSRLCSMPNLSHVSLQIKPSSLVQSICHQLCGNISVTQLDVDVSVFKHDKMMLAVEAVAMLVRANRPGLESLAIGVTCEGGLSPIIQALHTNDSLKTLKVAMNGIRHFSFGMLPQQTTDAISTMLQHNYVLEQIQASNSNDEATVDTWSDPSIPFYLKLNRAGRGRLLRGASSREDWIGCCKEDWIDTIIANREDTSVVFYFLSKNPLLLSSDDVGSSTDNTGTEELQVLARPFKRPRLLASLD